MIRSKDFLGEDLVDLKADLKDTIKAEITNQNQIVFTEEFLSTNENLKIIGVYKADETYIFFEDDSGQKITEDINETTESHETLFFILKNVLDSSNTTIQL